MPAEPTPLLRRWYLWAVPIVLLVIVLIVLQMRTGEDLPSPSDTGGMGMESAPPPQHAPSAGETDVIDGAYTAASDYVRNMLRDPAAAQLPPEAERRGHVTALENNLYRITSYVSAPDATGEVKRLNYTIDLRLADTGDFNLSALELDGKKVY